MFIRIFEDPPIIPTFRRHVQRLGLVGELRMHINPNQQISIILESGTMNEGVIVESDRYLWIGTRTRVNGVDLSSLNLPSPTVVEESDEPLSSCSICLEDIKVGQRQQSMPHCSHMYHYDCCRQWLERSPFLTCPDCRSAVSIRGGTPSNTT